MLLLLLSIGTAVAATPDSVAIVFRHGQRTPEGTFPKDPYKHIQWESGFGGLAEKGIQQMFELGQKLRTRYPHMNYSYEFHNDVLIKSSSKDRAIVSGQAFMAGFLNPTHNGSLPQNLFRSGIQVIPKAEDNLINFEWVCSKYQNELKNLIKNPPKEIQQFLRERPTIMDDIYQETGFEPKNILYAWWIYNVLKVQEEAGLNIMPSLKEIQESFKPFPILGFRLLTHSRFMRKVKGGVLLADIINQLKSRLSGLATQTSFVYSGHDLTIFHLLSALGIRLDRLPGYGATIIFEFYREIGEIKLFYMNEVSESFEEIPIPRCTAPCKLETLDSMYSEILVKDNEELAQLCLISLY